MSILRKLTVRTLKKNPKRTLVTIVGIILATALITAVANLATSFQTSVVIYEREEKGDFHYCFKGVKAEDLKFFENNVNVKKMAVSGEVGYAQLADSKNPDKPYIYILSMGEECRNATSLKLNSGRWAERENEIVISSHMRSNGGCRLTVGDKVTLTMGVRDVGDGCEAGQNTPYDSGEEFAAAGQREYTVVGVMQRPSFNVEPYSSPGYTAVTCVSDCERQNVYASYTSKGLKKRAEVTEALLNHADSVETNSALIRWETLHMVELYGNAMKMVYGMGGIAIAIIVVSSVFCIRNSFQISLTEKLRMYGMLSTVGTTSKQRRRLVYGEAACLSLIGIPLGIGSGVLATYVLVRVSSEMLRYAVDMKLYYAFSWTAVAAGAVLAVLTIFLSAFQSARKAAKISPISAIRSNETIRRGKKELRPPKVMKKLFGIGGVLAYKNLRRSRVKYRTTVISIVVSVAVFIAMTTFVRLGFRATEGYNRGAGYPIMVSLEDEERAEQAALICSWEEVQSAMLLRSTSYVDFPEEQLSFTGESLAVEEMGWIFRNGESRRNGVCNLQLYAMGENAYEEYCRKVGVSPEQAALGAVIYAEFRVSMDDGKGMKYYEGTIADFRKGDVLELCPADLDGNGKQDVSDEAQGEMPEKKVSLPVICQTKVQPDFMQGKDNTRILGIVSDAWLDENMADHVYPRINLYLQCEDADAMETRIRNEIPLYSFGISNYQRSMREKHSFWLLLAIFLYGFITVIALIGVTNIFNTVTTNMELRSREFAMLKSVGMTGREFKRMVQLESVFYGGGALGIGIPLGCVFSWLFYRVLGLYMEVPYELPLKGILISTAAVAVLLFVIMRYSMGRINRKNMIETIQNENI